MQAAQNGQGGAAPPPPIPKMDVSPPPAQTAREIRAEARQLARDVRAAAQDARKAAVAAQGAGQTATTTVPPTPVINPGDMIPPQAVEIATAFFVTVAVCVIGFPIARAIGRLLDRKVQFRGVTAPDVTPQLRQLQESIDAMAIEIERISEGQRFTAKVLAERSSASQ